MPHTDVSTAAGYLSGRFPVKPSVAAILGSGLGFLAESVENAVEIPYESIPGFRKPTVKGHAGTMVCGRFAGKDVAFMKGRYHFYEGHAMKDVTFPVRVLKELGVETLVITNAAGGINPFFEVGDLMLLSDHINFGPNPLIGMHQEGLEQFVSLDGLYSPELRKIALRIAEDENIPLREGVYLYTTGPSYETKAEIRCFHRIGADAVGMSTVPEAISARHIGISRVAAISLITNKTLGNFIPTHEEVMETSRKSRDYFARLVMRLISQL
ncbi:MAG: purine-nucleoside phosphorylase [Candidatus Wallbacteria bacterium]|nr:purine-nucleoside phosphorylase [Candidatus Wallbacteria bacterium]